MDRTAIVRDKRFLDHRTGDYHPENHKRLEVIYSMLDESDMAGRFLPIDTRAATRSELLAVHSEGHLNLIESTSGKKSFSLDPDTSTSAGSYEAALYAAGGLCSAVEAVIEGSVQNAFALVRPPGHHAERDRAMGFCLFNNVAVAAMHARDMGLERILIVDWDLHHGNGTQHRFEDDPGVLYFSTHQYPYYPGTGSFQECGRGRGRGYTVNVPLRVGHGDAEYAAIFQEILIPVALSYRPELILVSAGFDNHLNDPLGGMLVTESGFASMTGCLKGVASECCSGRIVMTLEGGYNLFGLRESVRAVLNELEGKTDTDNSLKASAADSSMLERALKGTYEVHREYWKDLRPDAAD